MFGVGGLLIQLEEADEKLREDAIKKLVGVVDEHWPEISDNLAVIEALSEDKKFSRHELAANVASRVFYHLESYDDAMRLALASGRYFDVNGASEYEVTMVGKCIDKYIGLRHEEAEVDPKLEAMIERMFFKCYATGKFEQALGIALEAHRLDKLEDTIRRSGSRMGSMISYCMSVSRKFVSNRAFRHQVFGVLASLFELQPDECNYFEFATCLHNLREVEKYANLLVKLVNRDSDGALIALQCVFDLVELQDQHFVTELLAALPQTSNEANDENGKPCVTMKVLRKVLSEDVSQAFYLHFLSKNNKTSLSGLRKLKDAIEQGRKNSVLHNASIVAHGYIQAGTTADDFLRSNLSWFGRANNWGKFSATASLGVIHKGNVELSMRLLETYLPSDMTSGTTNGPYSEGGAFYALGLIHACDAERDNASSAEKEGTLEYLLSGLEFGGRQETEIAREALQHGACLGIGLVAMSSGDQALAEKLLEIVYNDNAVAGEAAAIAIGMIMRGVGGSKHGGMIENMLSYSKDTGHEKITRALALAMSMIMYGQEEAADSLIEQLCRDKDPLLRYGGMYTIGMAYLGTANDKFIRRLLHVAVSDVNNDVRRAAVIALGFVMIGVPRRLPELVSLLSESYNPHVRYGACMALAIGCSQSDYPAEALRLLQFLREDKVDFVKQGALIACAMLLNQQNPETDSSASSLRAKISEIIPAVKLCPTMVRMGAILSAGIIDAGGQNVTIELISRNGFSKPPAVIGMLLWTQYWYWYPMLHMLSLSFAPTALIGVNAKLRMPINFSVECSANLHAFEYTKPPQSKKEKKQLPMKAAVLSTTARLKARAALKAMGESSFKMDIDSENQGKETQNAEKKLMEDTDKREKENLSARLTNPLRVTRAQTRYIRFKSGTEERYQPVFADSSHKSGIVVLKDLSPDMPEEVIEMNFFWSKAEKDGEAEAQPPEPFEWSES